MLRTRTFDTVTLLFTSESSAIDVFDTVKELTVACQSDAAKPSKLILTHTSLYVHRPSDGACAQGRPAQPSRD